MEGQQALQISVRLKATADMPPRTVMCKQMHVLRDVEAATTKTTYLPGLMLLEAVVHSPRWLPDAEVRACQTCAATFGNVTQRRHHCRRCQRPRPEPCCRCTASPTETTWCGACPPGR